MARVNRQSIAAMAFAGALLPYGGNAQGIARSFQELPALLKTGEIVIVIDREGREAWGQVAEVSGTSLSLDLMEKAPDRSGTLTTSRTRTFATDDVQEIVRSDLQGVKGSPIYPASWHKVGEVQPGAPITVFLRTGERRDYTFRKSGSDDLTLATASGGEETIRKLLVERVVRDHNDPIRNGVAYGAVTGAGTAIGMMAIMFARCGAGCEAPSPGPTYATAALFGGGIGAFIGWAIDKTHKGSEVLFPIVSTRRKGAHLDSAPPTGASRSSRKNADSAARPHAP